MPYDPKSERPGEANRDDGPLDSLLGPTPDPRGQPADAEADDSTQPAVTPPPGIRDPRPPEMALVAAAAVVALLILWQVWRFARSRYRVVRV